jgi:hypothetical protein
MWRSRAQLKYVEANIVAWFFRCVFCFLFWTVSHAADFELVDGERLEISLKGQIVAGDSKKLKKLLEGSGRETAQIVLSLDSDGGSLAEAFRIASMLAGNGGGYFRTEIRENAVCTSACAIIFMHGRTEEGDGYSASSRWMSSSGRLAFHSPEIREFVAKGDNQFDADSVEAAYRTSLLLVDKMVRSGEIPRELLLQMLPKVGDEFYEVKEIWQLQLWNIGLIEIRDPPFEPLRLPFDSDIAESLCWKPYYFFERSNSYLSTGTVDYFYKELFDLSEKESPVSRKSDASYSLNPVLASDGKIYSGTIDVVQNDMEGYYCSVIKTDQGYTITTNYQVDEQYKTPNNYLDLLPPNTPISGVMETLERKKNEKSGNHPTSQVVGNSLNLATKFCPGTQVSAGPLQYPSLKAPLVRSVEAGESVEFMGVARNNEDNELWYFVGQSGDGIGFVRESELKSKCVE